jgi:glyoxylase-like metal-dependent hydrolase (beta-lactamase superfamily II)
VEVTQLAPGLWRWTGIEPVSGQLVGSVYLEAPDAVVLIDPIVPPEDEERFWRALDRDVARCGLPMHVLLTAPGRARSSAVIAERYAAAVWDAIRPGDRLPGGVEARAAGTDEVELWVPSHGALVVGDAVFMPARGQRARPAPPGSAPRGSTG